MWFSIASIPCLNQPFYREKQGINYFGGLNYKTFCNSLAIGPYSRAFHPSVLFGVTCGADSYGNVVLRALIYIVCIMQKSNKKNTGKNIKKIPLKRVFS